ncbi:MAG: DEAD/DEAH box helicase [Thermodesulfobacteriota bacterium]|nr:DEAD/DEAH box helicase [Thermodesulfobacteriota bacterium]
MNRELDVIIMPNGSLQLEWTERQNDLNKDSRLLQEEIFKCFSDNPDTWLLFLGFCDQQVGLSPSLDFWRNFTGVYTRRLCRTPDLEILRHRAKVFIEEEELATHRSNAPMMTGAEYLSSSLLEALWNGLNKSFSREISSYKGAVAEFIRAYSPNAHLVGRVFFHLVENKNGDYPFAFMATYATRLNSQGKSKHLPLKHALQEYGDDNERLLKLLATVHTAAEKSPLIAELLETGELFHPLAWTSKEAFSFLKEIPLYDESGILCRIPNWWKSNKSSVHLNFSAGDKRPPFVGMDAVLNFNARLFLGDTPISEDEARRLLDESEGLAFIKNKWVAVDPEKLKLTLDAYEKAKKMMGMDGLSIRDALRLQLRPEKFLDTHAKEIDYSISNGKWLESVVQRLLDPDLIASKRPDRDFKARLRDYQQKGLDWLCFLHSLQFGACLADDMGLGKTIQALAFLNIVKSEFKTTKKPNLASLLIIPASLISNWASEIRRFFPRLKSYIAHPDGDLKKKGGLDEKSLDSFDLIITTYALIQRYDWLNSHRWNYVILDEAQAIKNPRTKQTRAIKNLTAANRIIMTGTPIENRLTDIWSLFDFLNPGLLGNAGEFKKFSKGLNHDLSGYSRLRRLISPYILRRLKTDKSVISDLPDKVEMKTYAALSKKQVVLYQNIVEGIRKSIAETEGIKRKGLILSSLTKFKQICNHPDQYSGTGGFKEDESGKFSRLREICETIYEKREKVLVFTQFKEMTEPLHDFLEDIFQRKGLVLHGSVAVGKRKKLIEQFQRSDYQAPFMVLSLKAGGVGLNLTEANHVIHFDRWWNPAVENQATDRAFRIGQKKNVIVHKFLTKGTVEEKIDMMLEDKSRLSQDVIAAGDAAWITEMKNNEIMDMFRLTL